MTHDLEPPPRSRLSAFLVRLIACAAACACTAIAAGQTTAFQLYGAQLSDGTYVTGTFTYDFTAGALTSLDITAEGSPFTAANADVSLHDIVGSYASSSGDTGTQTSLMIGFSPDLSSTQPSTISLSTESSSVVFSTNGGETEADLSFVSGIVIPVALMPQTAIATAGASGSSGWFHGPITFTLAAAAGRYPVQSTSYTLDGGPALAYTQPVTISAEGKHTVAYWSVDDHGFTETEHVLDTGIDTVAPMTTSYIYRSSRVTLYATDATSGVAGTFFSIDGGAVQRYAGPFVAQTFGKHTVDYWSVDVSGNSEAPTSVMLDSVDVTPPTTPGAPRLISSTATTKTVKWAASTDDVGVVKYVLYELRGHSGRGGGYSWVAIASSPTHKIVLPYASYYNVEVAAFDAAGNSSLRSLPGTF